MKRPNILIVGAGITGCTIARILAEKHFNIEIIESRNHIGGNIYDLKNEFGLRYHLYGPHLFHTNHSGVLHFLSRYTDWDPYFHKVTALDHRGEMVVFPIQKSMQQHYQSEDEIRRIFFEPYSKKMWNRDLAELDQSVLKRIGIRPDDSINYFLKDRYQALPRYGYSSMVCNMLHHENIRIQLNTPFDKSYEKGFDHVFYTGSIDDYFDFALGPLPYRSIKFSHAHYPIPQLLPTLQLNFTIQGPFTRMTDWSHLPENHRQSLPSTMLTFETPCDSEENNNQRYYPVKDKDGLNRILYNKYVKLAKPHITFLGRLGKYAYLDMDQAVASAMKIAEKFTRKY